MDVSAIFRLSCHGAGSCQVAAALPAQGDVEISRPVPTFCPRWVREQKVGTGRTCAPSPRRAIYDYMKKRQILVHPGLHHPCTESPLGPR